MAELININTPSEFIAAVPGLLGFTPSQSVVIVTFTGDKESAMHCALRMDLPQRDHTTTLVAELRMLLAKEPISAALPVVVGGTDTNDDSSEPPLHEFVAEFRRMAASLGISVAHAFWVDRIERGQLWRCYGDDLCFGSVPDPHTSLVTVTKVAEGEITYGSRDDLAAQLTADPQTDLNRRAALLRQLPPVTTADALVLVSQAVDQIAAGEPTDGLLDDDRIVRLVQALTDHEVRDTIMKVALCDHAAAAEHLWSLLTRAAPRPEATHPAFLLAISCAARGDGALANIAIDIALTADQGNRTAELLGAVLTTGLPPRQLRQMLQQVTS